MDKTNIRTARILKILEVIAWITFIGFSIEAGAIITAFVVSWFHPEAAKHIYKDVDLRELRSFSFLQYVLTISVMALIAILKAQVCYTIIKAMSTIKITNPFTYEVAGLLVKISKLLLAIWIVTALNFIYQQWLLKQMGHPLVGELGGESLLMAGLIFVIAQIFKRGVEIQSENELTV